MGEEYAYLSVQDATNQLQQLRNDILSQEGDPDTQEALLHYVRKLGIEFDESQFSDLRDAYLLLNNASRCKKAASDVEHVH